MKQADIETIKQIVETLGKASTLGGELKQVEVEPSDNGLGGDFLRVSLHLEHPERITWANVADLVRSIEDSVLAIDDRFPSVRFPDAE